MERVCFDTKSPYTCSMLLPIIKLFKAIYGLHAMTFNAPVFKMLNI